MRLYISATLRNFFDKNEKLETDAKNINEAFAWVRDEYPDAAKVLFDDDGELRSFIRIYAGDNDLTAREKWDDPLKETEEVLLLPAIAGGAPEGSIISDERRKAVAFDDAEIERFGKHLMLRDIGVKGQKRIKASRVVIAGAGALGSAVIQYLAAAGVGTMKVIDFISSGFMITQLETFSSSLSKYVSVTTCFSS